MALHFTATGVPFSIAHQKAITQLYGLFPPRFQAQQVYVQQVAERDWKHGSGHYGWCDLSGNITLLAKRWPNVPGIACHELGHAFAYQLWTPAEAATWAAFYPKHKRELGTSYAERSADEGWAELVVCILRPGLPNYRAASAAALGYGRSLLK
jgi:hypothetical protein